MWVFTEHGFFSATRSLVEPDKIQIRARNRDHLVRLRDRMARIGDGEGGYLRGGDILETPEADYQWRMIVAPETWVRIMADVSFEVDYSNFKGRCGEQDWADFMVWMTVLHDVWSVLNSYQYGRRHPKQREL